MPVGAQGSAFKLYGKVEATEGTAPTGNWDQFPCFSFGLTATQELQQDNVLSSGTTRDAGDPLYGLIRVEGSARVPIETVHFGRWLKLLMGAPTTSGATNYTHTFKTGASTLPSFSFEKAFPDITRYEVAKGVRGNTLQVSMAPDGAAAATIGLMGLAETNGSSSGAGTPVVTSYTRFHNVNGSISKGGTALAAVTGGEFTITNDMEMVPAIRSDYAMEGIDFGQSGASGTLTLRFKDHTLRTDATNRSAVALAYALTIDANTSVTFNFPRAFLAAQGNPIEGPRGVSQAFRFVAAFDGTAATAASVVYKNQVASYA